MLRSGGGRANWGMLRGFDEFWVSDNTDAMQRIYMQYGTSYFFQPSPWQVISLLRAKPYRIPHYFFESIVLM